MNLEELNKFIDERLKFHQSMLPLESAFIVVQELKMIQGFINDKE